MTGGVAGGVGTGLEIGGVATEATVEGKKV
jgi:hypothetical protein